jgi:hypothetical protein
VQKPQRPFIPHRTPKASRPVTTHSEFRMGRPFVPGSFREVPEAAPITTAAPVAEVAPVRVAQRTDRDQLPPIEVFLDDEVFPGQDEEHEPPPVEHFLDPLPAVGGFAPDADGALMEESPVAVDYASAPATGRPETEAGWGVDDWQQYDWRAAATLGEGVESQASNEWATTNWDTATPGARKKLSAAQAIANALDQIAQQIREGDLTIPSQSGALTNPGAISATLAALLGVRR